MIGLPDEELELQEEEPRKKKKKPKWDPGEEPPPPDTRSLEDYMLRIFKKSFEDEE